MMRVVPSFFLLIILSFGLVAFLTMLFVGLRMLLSGNKRVLAMAGLCLLAMIVGVFLFGSIFVYRSFDSAAIENSRPRSTIEYSRPRSTVTKSSITHDGITYRQHSSLPELLIVDQAASTNDAEVAPVPAAPADVAKAEVSTSDWEDEEAGTTQEADITIRTETPKSEKQQQPKWLEEPPETYEGHVAQVVSSSAAPSSMQAEIEVRHAIRKACESHAGRILQQQGIFDVWPIEISEKMINFAKRESAHEIVGSHYGQGHVYHQLLVYDDSFAAEVNVMREQARVGQRLKTAGVLSGATLSGLLVLFGTFSFVQYRRDRKKNA